MQKSNGRASSMARGLLTGTAISLVTTIICAMILAKLIDTEVLAWENVGYGIIAALMVASYLGAWISYSRIKHQRFLVCMISGLLFWLTLACITVICYHGEFHGFAITGGLILGGSMTAFFLTAPRKSRGRLKNFKTVHR